MIKLSKRQARRFMLIKHGLLGEYKFAGKSGALSYIKQVGCIQYDPIDVCGKNSELTLQSRVKNFTKATLRELLYADRSLVDYPDKNLSIIPLDDWPYFERYRQAARQNAENYPGLHAAMEQARDYINERGPVCSGNLPVNGEIDWRSSIHWSRGSNTSRAALEQMYSMGELIIHHKEGSRKYYDLAEKYIPLELLNAPEPLPDDFEHQKWRVLRRIGAVGLLWNRPSDAWLNIWGLNADTRGRIFQRLLDEGKILEIFVEGQKEVLFARIEDKPIIESVLQDSQLKPRCELIAPLDNMLWDRRLIKSLFGFDYTWEIYVPQNKRKYGYYVLPLLYGEDFAGRVEAIAERKSKTLVVKNIWFEDNVRQTKKLSASVNACVERFARFNGCGNIGGMTI